MSKAPDPIVSPTWLAERLEAPDMRVVDATWFLPGDERNAKALYEERRIPGAVFFDIDEIADTDSHLPHMLPSPEKFASRMRKLGIGDGARVVVYDNQGLFSAARVWWTFRVMGHEDVSVLDGGFPAWERGGFPIDGHPPATRAERHFTARYRGDLVRNASDVRKAIADAKTILDARPAPRFRGETPEPRAGLKSGHMPGARSLPAGSLINENGSLRSKEELEELFAAAGADPSQPAICSCGSGVTAAIIALALARLGHWDAAIYDGAWAEWGALPDAPIATGA
ncbi:3-mercaptopyruvate sulfurtransferase [Vitreimonas flagellata]|uniref:3-mercaptopyruvate sulfurtransferase n=1 Tax=Vitreimonas flagellata TaxID=2560861 RepID=UPI001074F7DC|nr:3-mercaptopyruvate sulfurtransferase [Vitreimonas flagellata]